MPLSPSDSALEALAERLAEDLAERWQQGERPLAEEYFSHHPELIENAQAAVELIYEEMCQRRREGEDAAGVLRRFPRWQAQLQVLLDCHQLLEAGTSAPDFPASGEELGDFLLLAELGRGAQGRVFLAKQPTLADRPVVLKLIPLLGWEHLSLARLQHTHIVPLYSVHDFPGRRLRALCLPYFGGLSLAALLQELGDIPLKRRSGQHLIDTLRRMQRTSPVALEVRGPACQLLARASYVEAVCWIGACLADALQYAHERGVLHLDLKPANVLLAADGQPMLLDFHLARPPLEAGAKPPDWLGGTPAYMAPEQREACLAIREGQPISRRLDARADLYALGVLLFEALSGMRPIESPTIDLCRLNPGVSPGLADIVAKCLATSANERYADAAALAGDLRRHLNALPLKSVANRNWGERWRKWRRRRPSALIFFGLLAVILLGLGLGGLYVTRQLQEARTALVEGRHHLDRQEYAEASSSLKRGLVLSKGLPFGGELHQHLQDELRRAETIQAARELHQFLEGVRVAVGGESTAIEELRAIEERCQELWQQRNRIAAMLEQHLPLQSVLHDDLLDLAILWIALQMRLSTHEDVAAAHQQALETLNEAEKLCGPSCVLCRERQLHATALGMTEYAKEAARWGDALQPRTAWENDALGRMLLEAGDLTGAALCFDRALKLEPRDLWANFHKGRCDFLLGRSDEALAAFSACVAIAPESAWCYYNRGIAYAELGRLESARRDYDRALQLDSRFAAALLARGLLHYREKRLDAALEDLNRALLLGANPAAAHHALALVKLASGDRAAALAELQEALRHEPGHKEARSLLERLRGAG